MREIKFRVWNPIEQKLEYWTLNDLCYHGPNRPDICLQNWQEYTGLKDKNGKEIYENDIVNYGDNFPSLVIWDEFAVGETPGFWLEERGNYDRPRFHTMTAYTNPIEVIGNIYENPELLDK